MSLPVPILDPMLFFASWSSISESFRLSSNNLSPGKFFLITLIRIICLPYAPGTLGLCLCCYTDSELTPVMVRRNTPWRWGPPWVGLTCSGPNAVLSTAEVLLRCLWNDWMCTLGFCCVPADLTLLSFSPLSTVIPISKAQLKYSILSSSFSHFQCLR